MRKVALQTLTLVGWWPKSRSEPSFTFAFKQLRPFLAGLRGCRYDMNDLDLLILHVCLTSR